MHVDDAVAWHRSTPNVAITLARVTPHGVVARGLVAFVDRIDAVDFSLPLAPRALAA